MGDGLPILVVDDDADTRAAVCEVLRDDGYRVVAAASGREALDLLRRGLLPQGILLDMAMPDMNGWQFLAERARSPALIDIPVIVMSALPRGAQTAGVVAFQRKPFHIHDLLTAVARTFGGPRRRSGQADQLVNL